MPLTDTRRDVLYIVNEVLDLLGYDKVRRLDSNKQSKILLRLLNNLVEDLNYGDWEEYYGLALVTAVPGQREYTLGIKDPVQRIFEIAFESVPRALDLRDLQQFNQLERSNNSTGVPRQYTIRGTDGVGNPKFAVHLIPSTAQASAAFQIHYYKKVPTLDCNDADTILLFPSNVLIQGLYAHALLEQNGGQLTNEAQYAFATYEKLAQQALNKYNGDTGVDVQFRPRRR